MTRKMKDSGVEWIGEIPEDWEIQNLKSILEERNEMNNPIETESILSLTNDRGVIPYSEKGDIGNKSKEDLTKYKLVYPNDIVVNSMNVIIGSVGLSDYFGATSPVYYMLYPRNNKDSVKYYNYLFQTKEFQSKLVGYGNGIMEHRMRIPMMNLNKVHLPYPDSLEQKAIADFLDEKTQEIDNIISKTKKAIEEYKKYKQSLITETVTKGLDENAKMKDSGIEWIGEIPEHWDITFLKNISKIGSGFTPSRNIDKYWINGTINWMSSGEINQEFIYETKEKLNNIVSNYYKIDILKPNTIMMALIGQGKTKGKVGILKIDAICNQNLAYIISNENLINYKFLYYYLKSLYEHLRSIAGESQAGIYLKDVKSINTLIPQLEEQEQIARYLDKKTNQIDQIISTKEKLLREMEAYKKSLIYETVTGKREVE